MPVADVCVCSARALTFLSLWQQHALRCTSCQIQGRPAARHAPSSAVERLQHRCSCARLRSRARAPCARIRVVDLDVCVCDLSLTVICLCVWLARVGTGLVQIGVHKSGGARFYTRVSEMLQWILSSNGLGKHPAQMLNLKITALGLPDESSISIYAGHRFVCLRDGGGEEG